jgi:signal peptidase II
VSPRRLGAGLALATVALDQVTKLWLLFVYELTMREPKRLAPVLDLMVVWNRGISYGLFQQYSEVGRWGLVALSIVAAFGLSLWMARTASRFLAAALALVAGGAVGNAIDRIAHGAVFDFVHLHLGSWSWYVFNVADAAIVAGVAGLLYDGFVLERRRGREPEPGDIGQAATRSPE